MLCEWLPRSYGAALFSSMFRRVSSAALALLGLLGAHELTYRLVGGSAYQELLHSTGHSWRERTPTLIFAAFIALSIATLLSRDKKRGVPFAAVLALQTGGYAAVEVLERVLNGHHAMPSLSLAVVGIALQLPVAALVWGAHRFVILTLEGLSPLVSVNISPEEVVALFDTERVIIKNFSFNTGGRGPPLK